MLDINADGAIKWEEVEELLKKVHPNAEKKEMVWAKRVFFKVAGEDKVVTLNEAMKLFRKYEKGPP